MTTTAPRHLCLICGANPKSPHYKPGYIASLEQNNNDETQILRLRPCPACKGAGVVKVKGAK